MADDEGDEGDDEDGGRQRRGLEHLSGLPDGCGCAEVWEYNSGRASGADDE
jgi:hypothetical protein